MRRLLLVRHGQTAWNVDGRAQGHADVELDDTGHLQAKTVAPLLATYDPQLLWCSDLARARETAEYVAAATGLEAVADAQFREYAVGPNRQGLTLQEYAEQHPREYADLVAGRARLIPGRETTEDVTDRYLPGLRVLADRLHPGRAGVLISHGAAIRTGLIAFLGWPADAEHTLSGLDNCAWVELHDTHSRWNGGEVRWRLAAYNRRSPGPIP